MMPDMTQQGSAETERVEASSKHTCHHVRQGV